MYLQLSQNQEQNRLMQTTRENTIQTIGSRLDKIEMTIRNAKNVKSFHLYRCWARRDEIQDGVQVRGRETHHILCSRPDHQGDYRDDDDDEEEDYDHHQHYVQRIPEHFLNMFF